jgi:hypothetical protein
MIPRPTFLGERYDVQRFWTNDTLTDEITVMYEFAAPTQTDIDGVAAISRERIKMRERAEHEKAITEPGKSKICTS